MTAGKVITSALHRIQRGHGRVFVAEAPRGPVRRPARVAIMLALAHKLREAVTSGNVHSQADVARTIGLTPARVTQLLDMLHLAPDIQEQLLFLQAIDGVEPLTERQLRALTRQRAWAAQRLTFSSASGRGSRLANARVSRAQHSESEHTT